MDWLVDVNVEQDATRPTNSKTAVVLVEGNEIERGASHDANRGRRSDMKVASSDLFRRERLDLVVVWATQD